MPDVTFGVKVSEEMKSELSELIKESTLSGKEFMGMLIASYKMEQSKQSSELYTGDLKELQGLIKRIQNIFVNMIEKSDLEINDCMQRHEAQLKESQNIQVALEERVKELEKVINEQKESLKQVESDLIKSKKQLVASKDEVNTYKQQLKNQGLLYVKFEEQVKALEQEIESYKRLEIEIKERNSECDKLRTRNDEMASEVWFLKREIEKNELDKNQVVQKYSQEIKQLKTQFELELKNALLEQKLSSTEEREKLREKISELKDRLAEQERKEYDNQAKKK